MTTPLATKMPNCFYLKQFSSSFLSFQYYSYIMIFLRNLTVVHTLLSLLKFFRHTVRVYRTFNYKEAGSLRLFGCLIKCCLVSQPAREERTERGQLRFFFNLGRTVRADILDQIFLGSQKTSQMAAYVPKSKNVESSLNFNNLFSNKYPNNMFDLTKWLIAIVFTYFLYRFGLP